MCFLHWMLWFSEISTNISSSLFFFGGGGGGGGVLRDLSFREWSLKRLFTCMERNFFFKEGKKMCSKFDLKKQVFLFVFPSHYDSHLLLVVCSSS